MSRYVLVDTASHAVINLVEYAEAPSNPPPGFEASVIAIQHDTADVTWTWKDGALLPPPAPTAPPVTKVLSVTPKQARIALAQAGILAQVNDMVRAADEVTQITWDYALTINRDDPLIVQMGTSLGLSSDDIDALFLKASLIL